MNIAHLQKLGCLDALSSLIPVGRLRKLQLSFHLSQLQLSFHVSQLPNFEHEIMSFQCPVYDNIIITVLTFHGANVCAGMDKVN